MHTVHYYSMTHVANDCPWFQETIPRLHTIAVNISLHTNARLIIEIFIQPQSGSIACLQFSSS